MRRGVLTAMLFVAALGAGCGSSSASRPSARRSSPVPAPRRARVSSGSRRLGRSQLGRPIVALRAGDPNGVRVLVVGCIHGNEGAGIPVARALARTLIRRVRPRVTIWFHQHMDLVWAWGPSSAAGRSYARAAGMRFYHQPWLNGTAANWQNHHQQPEAAAITVELPAGSLSPKQIRRQVHAVLTVAARTRGPVHA